MPALKYWNGTAWVNITGGGGPAVPDYRQVAYPVSDHATGGGVNITATAYGAHTGPAILAYVGPSGVAAVHFYAQIGLAVGGPASDLVTSVGVTTYPAGAVVEAPNDNFCIYVAPFGTGPGFISGVLIAHAQGPGQFAFTMHHRVSVGTTNMLRRRMVVMPIELVAR